MKKFFYDKRMYFSIAAYFAAVFGIFFLVAVPKMRDIQNRSDEIQRKSEEQQIRRERLEEMPRLKEQFDMLEGVGNDVNFLLDKNMTINLIEDIESISSATGNQIKIEIMERESVFTQEDMEKKQKEKNKNKNGEKTISEKYSDSRYLRLRMTIEGKYANFVDFMRKIENMGYYSEVISIRMKKTSSDSRSFRQDPYAPVTSGNTSQEAELKSDDKLESSIEVLFFLK